MRRLAAAAATIVALLFPTAADAQLHGDASLQVGVRKRFLFERPPGGDDAGFGPAIELMGHVAVFPLVRAGVYLGHDISPLGGVATARDVSSGGLRGKVLLPWFREKVRAWAFLGFGYAIVSTRSYATSLTIRTPGRTPVQRDVEVLGAGGGFFEVPFGIGASYKFFKPWELCAELGARIGFAHSGSAYEIGPQVVVPGDVNQNLLPSGNDSFALGLTIGILLDL
jgi:hypothetical protein